MRRIIITGAGSYIGESLASWLETYPGQYAVEVVDTLGNCWLNKDFRGADAVVNVAGIAHVRENRQNATQFYLVNRDLACALAQKAKVDGVQQFIQLSSMSVYGLDEGVITAETKPAPRSHYGLSKLQGEQLISELADESFRVAIVRAPMVYGKGCPGNYQRLRRLALLTPVFPSIRNQRSMIYIDHLCEFIRGLVDNSVEGVFFPQNKEYVCTSEMVRLIAQMHRKKVCLTPALNALLQHIKLGMLRKLFGDLVYVEDSSPSVDHSMYDFEETIWLTEL
ncbi:MAG: NAD-dependent epimerase/dehydratase family protein [Selenomonadales bacterium]|nr:NAD-dependent epimerase/dehydratase family protein [Selenomonadales bacterium]